MASNLALLEDAAGKLQYLLDQVVFVGGATLDLLVTELGAAPLRTTFDVDVVIAADYGEYVMFTNRLRDIGFTDDVRPDAPLCRFVHGDLTLDVMSDAEQTMGFTNRWYKGAVETAQIVTLASGRKINRIAAPFFLGTKMEGFHGRGKNDYFMSHDLEDFITVVDGRQQLLQEIAESTHDLRRYLSKSVSNLLAEDRFLDALPGYVLGDAISQRRVPIILDRLQAISHIPGAGSFARK